MTQSTELPAPETFAEAADRILRQALTIMLRKRDLRGTENIERQGEFGVLNRIELDKLSRIRRDLEIQELVRLSGKYGTQGGYEKLLDDRRDAESVEDDILDVINYAVILLALRRGWWSLPTTHREGKNE